MVHEKRLGNVCKIYFYSVANIEAEMVSQISVGYNIKNLTENCEAGPS